MILTKKQEEGLALAVQRYKDHEAYTCISGYAGSGKSTLIKFIIDALQVNPDLDVAYITFTGKASIILRDKGCPNAMTAHKLLYESRKGSDGKFYFKPKLASEIPEKIIIVDEISMLPKYMWDLLLSHKKYVIAVGDPFQIPPIASKGEDNNNHVLDNPHIFLDEIMRQAKENEIIRVSMDIREGRSLDYFKGKEVCILPPHEADISVYKWGDQIITATNVTRRDINNQMRKDLGFLNMEPQIGDKIISLTNHWDYLDSSGDYPLINGTIGYLREFSKKNIYYPISAYGRKHLAFPSPVNILSASFVDESGNYFKDAPIDYKSLVSKNGEHTLNSYQEYAIYHSRKCRELGLYAPMDFNYGYAITCHKAQGSQWDKVVVVEENFPYDEIEHARWLYTAVTRAASKCVLIR